MINLKTPFQHGTYTRAFRLNVAFSLLVAASTSWGQITNVTNDQATPMPGVGHDYIGTLNDIVNPANGSLSIRIPIPTPPGRGLNLPLQFSYNSAGIIQMSSTFGTQNGGSNYDGGVQLYSNKDLSFLEQGGWGYGLPVLSGEQIQVPGNSPHYQGATCPVSTGFVFTDPSGSRHSMALALPNYVICNGTGLGFGYPVSPYYSAYDGSYSAWTTNGGTTSNNDVQALPFSISDNSGTYYYFPYLLPIANCIGSFCNVPSYMEDRNGNIIRIQWESSANPFPLSVTDTAGRTLMSIGSFDSASGDQINISGITPVSGMPSSYVVKWESVPYNITIPITAESANSSTCEGSFNPSTSGTAQVVSSIELPNGESYQFQYDATYGLLKQITYPTGAYVQYSWGPSQQPSDAVTYAQYGTMPAYPNQLTLQDLNECWATYSAPVILTRTVSFDGASIAQQQTFSYSTAFPGEGGWTTKQTTVTTTDLKRPGSPSFKTIYTYSANSIPPAPDIFTSVAGEVPLENTIQYYDFNGSLLRTVTKSWGTGQYYSGGKLVGYPEGNPDNPVLVEQDTTLPNGQTSRMVFTYDGADNIIEKDEYDYGQSTQTRTTTTQYIASLLSYSFPPSILDAPCKTIVYAGISSGSRVAETDLEYDGGTTLCTPGTQTESAVSNLPSGTHDETNFGPNQTTFRGNITSSVKWASTGTSPMTTYIYDETGQVLQKTDPCGNPACPDMPSGASHTTTYSYANNFTILSGGTNVSYTPSRAANAFVTQITDPLNHTENFSYDYNTSQLTSAKDENSKITNYTYNTPPSTCSYPDGLYRLSQVSYPDGGVTSYCYNDSVPSVTTTTLATPDPTITKVSIMDGVGHVIHTQLTSDPNGTDYVDTTYDGEGHVYTQTNSYRGSSPPAHTTTTHYYDALGRPIETSEQDGSALQWCYNGVGSTPAVYCNSSHLGSVTTGTWVDSTDENNNHWQRTSDSFGRLTEVVEPSGLSQSPTLETDYGYDALNNLLSVKQCGALCSSPAPNGPIARSFHYDSLSRLYSATNPESGAVGYIYDVNGNVLSKTDARGVRTLYQYDALNRVLGKTYSGDASNTPLSCYQYDSSSATCSQSSPNWIGRLTNAWTQSASTTSSCSTSASFLTKRSISCYDAMGRVTQEQQFTLASQASGKLYSPAYTYDLAGNLTSSTDGVTPNPTQTTWSPPCPSAPTPSSGSALTFVNCYDAAGRLQSVTSNWNDGTHPSLVFAATPSSTLPSYAPFGALQNAAFSNSGLTLSRTYDNRLRITGEADAGSSNRPATSGSATVTITGSEKSQ